MADNSDEHAAPLTYVLLIDSRLRRHNTLTCIGTIAPTNDPSPPREAAQPNSSGYANTLELGPEETLFLFVFDLGPPVDDLEASQSF